MQGTNTEKTLYKTPTAAFEGVESRGRPTGVGGSRGHKDLGATTAHPPEPHVPTLWASHPGKAFKHYFGSWCKPKVAPFEGCSESSEDLWRVWMLHKAPGELRAVVAAAGGR